LSKDNPSTFEFSQVDKMTSAFGKYFLTLNKQRRVIDDTGP